VTLRVLALCTAPSLNASNRLRIEQYGPLLRDEGIELEVAPYFDDETYAILHRSGHTARKVLGVVAGAARRVRDLWRARDTDLLLVHRESTPLGPPMIEALWRSRMRPYVFDFDDAVFVGDFHPANRRWSWLRQPSRVAPAVRGAAAVVAGNEYLAGWARGLNPNVTVLPTPVDTDRHRPRAAHDAHDPLVLGWVGSSTTARYLRILDEPLGELAKRRSIVFRVVGGEYEHRSARVEVRPYRVDSEPAELAGFDIGVLPQPDDPWTRGKGAFKALLYMATGLPVVASSGGVNSEVVRDGETGFCVDGCAEWVEALDRLASDPALRQRMGEAGRARVEAHYSLRVLAPRLAKVLQRAARHT